MTDFSPQTGIETATRSQQVASTPSRSAWVSANAGSGKTYVLVNRIIRLMLDGAAPEKIVCITFTKAAAAEMSNRLFERLAGWVSLDNDTLKAEIETISGNPPGEKILALSRKLFARSLETPGGIKIQTIDSFCESLLHRFPLEAGIAPGFEVLDEVESAALKKRARNHILSHAMENKASPLHQALSHIVARAEGDQFDELLDHILKGRERFIQNIHISGGVEGPDILTSQCDRLKHEIGLSGEESRAAFFKRFANSLNSDRQLYQNLIAVLKTGSKNDIDSAGRLEAALRADKGADIFENMCEFYFTKAGPLRSSASLMTKKTQAKDPELVAWMLARQAEFPPLREQFNKIMFFETNQALYLLSDAIDAAYKSAKRQAGKLDFDDLISLSVNLFKRVSGAWVLYKIDGGLDHILVDEAQDTSPAQWQLIGKIAEEFFAGEGAREQNRTIFAVGDEKQSIFSFRGADPSQFDKMRRYFEKQASRAEKDFRPVPLSVSFRSTGQLLSLVDKIFDSKRAAKGLTYSGQIDQHIPTRSGQAGLVELWQVTTSEKQDEPDPWDAPLDWVHPQRAEHLLAGKIARKIRKWLDAKEILKSRGRPVEPGDILILVQKRKIFFEAMLRALKAQNIPVAGADRMALGEQMAVMDMVALGRVMLLPDDNLSLACILKSPFFDLGEEDLFTLAHDRGGASLWQSLKTGKPEIYNTLRGWRSLAQHHSVFDFYSSILNEQGGRKKMVGRLGEESHDPIDEFLALALDYDQTGGGSMQEFLHRFNTTQITIKRDMEHGKNEVRLMTVHGAKGLEGNIVFLPETCILPAMTGSRVNFTSLGDGVSSPRLPIWALKKKHHFEEMSAAIDRDREAQMEENRRLLYVALTRARDRLYICGYGKEDEAPEGCWYDLARTAFDETARELEDEEGDRLWRLEDEQSAEPRDSDDFSLQTLKEKSLPDWVHHKAPEEDVPPRPLVPSRLDWELEDSLNTATGRLKTLDQTIISPLDRSGKTTISRFKRGNLIHQLMQYLPEIDPSARRSKAEHYLRINGPEFDGKARAQMCEQVSAIMEDERYQELFSENSRAEVPISALIELQGDGRQLAIKGQIDRLVVTDRQVLIVDYKTNRPPPDKEEDVAPLYLRQMAAYRMILQTIYPGHEIQCALLWTDAPRLMALTQTVLEKALKRETGP